MEGSISYAAGMICGILMVAIIAVIGKRRRKVRKKCDYDERQLLARGKAFQYGFFILLIYNMISGAMYDSQINQRCEASVLNAFGVAVAIFVVISYCIWKDAYMSLREKPLSVYLLLGSVSIPNLLIGVCHIADGTFLEEGRLGAPIINLIFGVTIFLTLVVFFIKMRRTDEEEENE